MMRLMVVCSLVIGGLAYPAPQNSTIEKTIDETILEAMQYSAIEPQAVAAFDDETVMVELDMLYDKQEWDDMMSMQENPAEASKRGYALTINKKRWTNKIVPYVLDNTWTNAHKDTLKAVIADYQRWTCIEIKPRTNEYNYIRIQDGNGCNSFVGMLKSASRNGMQQVNLGVRGCRSHATMTHELGHAIGFHHEQNRPDRDNYITVVFANVKPRFASQFKFQKKSSTYGVAYDYGSVMHYGGTSFSIDKRGGKKTMITKDPAWQDKIGKAPNLSFADLKVANIIYDCGGHCGGKTCPSNGYLDKNCKCMCKGPSATDPVKECGCKKRTSIIDNIISV